MKTIIAGSRLFDNYEQLSATLLGEEITEVVCGCYVGADMLGWRFAKEQNIPVKFFPADWKGLGKKAGPMRNERMAKYADSLFAFWDGESRGTKNMIDMANKHKLKVKIIYF